MAGVAGVGLALSVAQTLFSALQTKEVREMCSMFHCETQLVKLQDTMSTIKAVLLDVESKRQGLTNEGQVWVEKLKDAVYDVDDLLDEFTTIAQQQKQDAKFSQKVGRFFSRNNKFFVQFNVSREIMLLRENLDAIAKNHADFGFTNVNKPVKRREETCSNICDLEVIGREGDKEAIVDMLLSNQDQNISYVSIVGIGGLGKTTLAQLVYNDERVKLAFSKRIWVCVSEEFDVGEIFGKMLGKKDLTLEEMRTKVQNMLERKRYLLVLDDVWNESHAKWRKLKSFLVSDVSGSKIIVTTRSKKVASSIGNESIGYELEGLSKENSWSLFKRIAFGEKEDQEFELVKIGKVIVKICANVPLSIRVVASLLYDQDKSQWLLFRDIGLAEISHGEDSIMPTLMFSYYNLTPELKSCFSLCSIFPKNCKIKKTLLINLWLALGFLVANHDGQSAEDVAEQYFTILLNRCFFQDIQLDDHGEVESCKMHDLMHDLALEVAGNESSTIISANKNHMKKKVRHLFLLDGSLDSNLCSSDTLRTFMWFPSNDRQVWSSEDVNSIISKGRRLRVLKLVKLRNVTLPNSFGKLLHLRYLGLSFNDELEMLPKSITKLHNLQILKLTQCTSLKELPEDTSKLVNLKTLDIYGCNKLTHMPKGMVNLKNLHTLPQFVVGGVDLKQVKGSKLVDLQALINLKGDLCIKIRDFSSTNMPHAIGRAFKLKDAHNLEILCGSHFCDQENKPYSKELTDDFDQSEVHETLVEQVCPNDDIGMIKMVGYQGMKMPSWASMLVNVKVSSVKELQHVTSLSQLCCLKVVELWELPNVEYIESEAAWELVSRPNNNNESKKVVFFPALEKLVLREMPKLKGWWREVRWEEMDGCLVGNANPSVQHAIVTLPYFPCLRELDIVGCHNMMYFPPCPFVKQLHVLFVNEALTFCMKGGVIVNAVTGTTSVVSSSTSRSRLSSSGVPVPLCLKKLEISNDRDMNSVLRYFVGGVVEIDFMMIFMPEIDTGLLREGFKRCASSLRHLSITQCGKMVEIGIEQLSNLQSLNIDFWEEYKEEEEDEEGMPWKNLQSLSSLTFMNCNAMVKLPKGLRYLGASLQSLSIVFCNNLEELGETIGFLTSLQCVYIMGCEKLKALPDSLKLLTSLQHLCLYDCPSVIKSLPKTLCHLNSDPVLESETSRHYYSLLH